MNLKINHKMMKMRDDYYHSFQALRNITMMLRFRYFAFSNRDKDIVTEKETDEGIKKTITRIHLNRYNRGHHHLEFMKTYDRFKFKEIQHLRLYTCLSTLKTSFPVLKRSGEERTIAKEKILETLPKYVTGYDFAWDFDAKLISIKNLRDEILEFIKFFDEYNVSYSVKFSGKRGFHVRIPADFLHPILQKDYKRIIKITKKIALYHNTLHIDTFGNDLSKLLKLEYSIDGKCPSFYVVLPLTLSQLKNFDFDFVSLPYVIKNIKLIDKNNELRGYCMHNFKDIETQHENSLKMVEDIEEW